MAKVCAIPEDIAPLNDSIMFDYEAYEKDYQRLKKELGDWCKKYSKCPHAGEIIDFPIADGKAIYMVFDYNQIIHIPFGDAWQIPDAHARGLIKEDIVQNVERRKAIADLFASK